MSHQVSAAGAHTATIDVDAHRYNPLYGTLIDQLWVG
jgi:hypothetical protein